MAEERTLPAWAEDLRRRYLRGESSMFVLHGNVYDVVVHGQRSYALTEFLCDVLLKESRETLATYNLASGVRFPKRTPSLAGLDELLLATDKARVLPALERLLDPANRSVTLSTLERAASAVGKKLKVELS